MPEAQKQIFVLEQVLLTLHMPSPEAVTIVLRVSSQVLFITPWCTSFVNFLCVFFRGLLAHIFSTLYWGCWLILALRGCYISFSFTPTAVPIIIHLCTIIWNTFFEFCLSPTATSPMVSCSDSEEPEYSPNNWSSLARVLSPEKLIKYITKRYFCLFPKYIFFWESDVDHKIMINTNLECFEREKTFTGALPLLVCRLRCVWFSRIHTKNIFLSENWNLERSWYFPTVPIVTQAQKLGCSRRNQFSYELWDVR